MRALRNTCMRAHPACDAAESERRAAVQEEMAARRRAAQLAAAEVARAQATAAQSVRLAAAMRHPNSTMPRVC